VQAEECGAGCAPPLDGYSLRHANTSW
jgi:hypothetical protein